MPERDERPLTQPDGSLRLVRRLRVARRLAARLKATRRLRALLLAVTLLPVAVLLSPVGCLVHHVYFDRSGMPSLESFIRFELPTTGVVRDAHGTVLIELAREYRRVVTYDEVPLILRQAILAAEDKSFFTHAGVDYRALPRVVQKTAARSMGEWRKGGHGLRLLLPQGGSTLREIMLRVYQDELVGPAPRFPRAIEEGIDQYLAAQAALEATSTEGQPAGATLPRTP